MKLLTSLLILSETVFGLRASCDENQLANVTNGKWECEPTENERGQSCTIKCDDGHYLPRPGPAKRARCKIDEDDNSRKTWIYPHMEAGEPMPEFKCLAGCSKTVIEQIPIKNGRWHCPLHDDDDDLIGPGLQCFATCDERYDLHDSQGGYYSMNKYSKICKCSNDSNRCHWARLDNVPECRARTHLGKAPRIINGQTAVAHSKPYMVSISVKTKGKKSKVMVHYCGGVLIHPNWIITAAHCKKSTKDMRFLLGAHDITDENELSQVSCKAVRSVPHPDYNGQTKHDIMLVQLKCDVKSSKYIMPAILPPANVDVKVEESCSICGWGNMAYPDFRPAEKLQCVDLPVIHSGRCNQGYKGAIHEDIMCIGLMKGGKDSCQGDSGGPAICDGRVHGIVMGGLYCAEANFPGVYTRVSHYVNWIKEVIRTH